MQFQPNLDDRCTYNAVEVDVISKYRNTIKNVLKNSSTVKDWKGALSVNFERG